MTAVSPELLVVGLLCLLAGAVLVGWPLAMRCLHLKASNEALDHELIRLRAIHEEKMAAAQTLQESVTQTREAMRMEFQSLASQVLEEKGQVFSRTSQASLDHLLQPFRDQIESFRRRMNEVHDATLQGQTRLGSEIRQVRDIGLRMSTEADNLASALKGDKKTTGNWGEIQLERSLQLAGLVAGDHYEAQASFRDEAGNHRQPDFVIKLPDGKHLVIDSKVSLVDYERAVAATDDATRGAALADHLRAVRKHVDELARKDYSSLIGMKSPGFVLMFMPVEPAYIEALRRDPALYDDAWRRNVVVVSHTTLMPILRTVANLWMLARSDEQARALGEMAAGVYNQVAMVAERLQKLGGSLHAASQHFNSTVTAVAGQQGLYGKVGRFTDLSIKAGKALPPLEAVHADLDVARLDGLAVAPEGTHTPGYSQN